MGKIAFAFQGANIFFRKNVFSTPAIEIELNRTYGKTNSKDETSRFKVVILWMKVETYNLSPTTAFHI